MAELFDSAPVEEMRGAEQAVREAAAAPENLRTQSVEELGDEDRAAIIDIARQRSMRSWQANRGES